MPVTVQAVPAPPDDASATILFVTAEAAAAGLPGLNMGADAYRASGFAGGADQVLSHADDGRVVGFVGLGPAAGVSATTLRRAGAAAARKWRRHERLAVSLHEPDTVAVAGPDAAQAVTEGVILGAYRYTAFKSAAARGGSKTGSKAAKLRHVGLAGPADGAIAAAVDRGTAIARGVCLARDLVNEPGGSLTPKAFARKAVTAAREAGLESQVWTRRDIKRERLGGLLGVNRGSAQPPRFVRISYTQPLPREERGNGDNAAPAAGKLALVGKGLTFDAGGLSIKTAKGMMTMKMDMAGAAAVVGAMTVLPALTPATAVTAYLPMTDNMLGGDATRPGDVLTIRNGKTIEVVNTDAEGRLVLADALSLASEDGPDAIVDLATLTGACMVALGSRIAGLMGNSEPWIEQVRQAARRAGERVWPLPLPADYESQFESIVADMKNIGAQYGGALTAGLILQHFVARHIAWAHLDIAGPAYADAEDGETCKGGTGFGVRTLVELVDNFTKPEPPDA